MTDILQKLIIDCSTGEATYVPLTADEIAEREAQAAAWAEQQAADATAAQAAADKRTAVLSALAKAAGLTVQEVTDALA